MSVKIMSAIFESETLGPTERLIMLALADHADDAGRCYPSISRLCKRTGLKERAMQGNIKSLVTQGYITIIPNAGQGLANLYFIRATPAADAPPQEMHPRTKRQKTPASNAQTPAADAPKPSLTIIEPSEEAKPRAKRASAIPENWVPSDRNLTDARARNFTDEEIHEQAAAFRDHHLARGTTFKDWDAGWRTWLGNARRFARPSPARNARPRSAHDVMLAGFQSAAMRDRD